MDCSMIVGALRKNPQTFTNLLKVTGLPRKTLSLRLKDLLKTGTITKNGGYCLNGHSSFPTNDRILMHHDKRRDLPSLKRYLQIVLLVLCISLPVAAHVYATYFAYQPMDTPPQPPLLPIASFTISPHPPLQISWIEQWNAGTIERIYCYPTLTFYGSASKDPDGKIANYLWDLGDNTFDTNCVVTHTYINPGTYTVNLTVTDNQGLRNSIRGTITILPTPKTTVYIDPPILTGTAIGENFTVNVMVSDVSDLYLWNVGVIFNPEVLECISVEKAGDLSSKRPVNGSDVGYIVEESLFPEIEGETIWVAPKIDNKAGVIGPGPTCGLIGDVPGVSGDGPLAVITFRVVSAGSSYIHLTDVHLANSDAKEIATNVGDSYFMLP